MNLKQYLNLLYLLRMQKDKDQMLLLI